MIGRGNGLVVRARGDAIFAAVALARVGDGVRIHASGGTPLEGEIVAVGPRQATIVTYGASTGIAVGDRVELVPGGCPAVLGFGALGRAFDAFGVPLDAKGPLSGSPRAVTKDAPSPDERRAICAPLWTGLRALDGLLTIGCGARVGIFGAAGTGKSSLLQAIARGVRTDALVVALVGERGREAQSWLAEVNPRTTLVCATSDRCAAERIRAAELAMCQASALRAAGLQVTLILDSIARYVDALREQHVALGEPVGHGGYPAGVWFALARLLERAGPTADGSITLLATVLSDVDERDPLAETARSLLDGHFVLSRDFARAGRFPAVDVLASGSRTMPFVVDPTHQAAAATVRATLARLSETEDFRAAGVADTNDPVLRRALEVEPAIEAFLRQREPQAPGDIRSMLLALAGRCLQS